MKEVEKIGEQQHEAFTTCRQLEQIGIAIFRLVMPLNGRRVAQSCDEHGHSCSGRCGCRSIFSYRNIIIAEEHLGWT